MWTPIEGRLATGSGGCQRAGSMFLNYRSEWESLRLSIRVDVSPRQVFPNMIPSERAVFVETEVARLVAKGSLMLWAQVKRPGGTPHPRLIQPLRVKPTKPRVVYDVGSFNEYR